MPEPFVEISEELAAIQGISNGDMVEIKTQRTNYYGPGKTMKARACVTKRLKPLTIDGNTTHVIGTIWHFGYSGIATGDSANLLTAHIGDANTGIPESKNFICNVRKYPGGAWL
jgi:formate dehydrogenase major subunit